MEPASPPLSVCLAMVCLLGAARLSSGDGNECPCPPIPPLPLTKPPPDECRQVGSSFRYGCADGYVRRAGTSNRVKCVLKDGAAAWEPSTLECIRDPTKPATQRTTTTAGAPTSSPKEIPPDAVVTTVRSATATSPTSPPERRGTPSEGGAGAEGSPHDAATPTTVGAPTGGTSTSSRGGAGNEPASPPGAFSGSAQAAVISVAALAIVCGLAGLAFLLYRRRSRSRAAEPPAEESLPMNPRPGL